MDQPDIQGYLRDIADNHPDEKIREKAKLHLTEEKEKSERYRSSGGVGDHVIIKIQRGG